MFPYCCNAFCSDLPVNAAYRKERSGEIVVGLGVNAVYLDAAGTVYVLAVVEVYGHVGDAAAACTEEQEVASACLPPVGRSDFLASECLLPCVAH